jgi:predicted permease
MRASLGRSLRRLRFLFRQDSFHLDLEEEMLAHIDLRARQLREQGIESAEAVTMARREFGNTTLLREISRDLWIWPWLESAWQDLRFAGRQLAKSPGLTAIAILTLALGIGANTAIFTLLNAVLLRSLPVQHAEELVFFGPARSTGSTVDIPNGRTDLFSYQFLREFRRENHTFANVAAVFSILFTAHGRVAGGSASHGQSIHGQSIHGQTMERIQVELISGSYFDTLGVKPMAGRLFTDEDDRRPGGHPVAVASYSWWQRRLAMSASPMGTTVTIGPTRYTVVGVAPSGFHGITVGQSPDLWIPLAMENEVSPGWNGLENPLFQSLHVIGRLAPGVSMSQAQSEMNRLFQPIIRSLAGPQSKSAGLEKAYVNLTPAAEGRSPLRRQFAPRLKVLMAVVALVLLIACTNVANLLLARGTARRREIAVRVSIGAGRWRVIRQLLVESAVLGLAGAAAGVGVGVAALHGLLALVSTGPDPIPLAVAPDPRVLGFTLAMTLVTILLFGMAPALFATKFEIAAGLKEGRSAASTKSRSVLARSLVIGQVALSLVLLAGAGLFLRSLTKLMETDTGFDRRNVLLVSFDPGAAGYKLDARLEAVMSRIEQRVGALPGVQGASFALTVFDGGGWTDRVTAPGQPAPRRNGDVIHNVVGPRYLDVMKMPILAGRGLEPGDNKASRKVAVINETMAKTYFPDVSPLGRTFNVESGVGTPAEWRDVEVVGVVRDAKYFTLEEKQDPAAFYPHAQHLPMFLFSLVARYSGDVRPVVRAMRSAAAEIDPNLPVGEVQTLVQHIDDAVLSKRLVAQLSALFGALAAFLACIGIYGVMSYGVGQRTGEFGVRMALGAQRANLPWMVLREAMALGAAGVTVGLILVLAGGRLIAGLLFGVEPYDPVSTGSATIGMIAIALAAGLIPARRATRIDPMGALRNE